MDRRVELPEVWVSALGGKIKEFTLRATWCGKAAPDAFLAEDVRAAGDTLRFTLGEVRFVYDRWGLRKNIENDEVDDDHT